MADDLVGMLEHAIAEGYYATDRRLPSERELSKRFRVSTRTARAALATLEERGLIYRIERGGSFIRTAPKRLGTPSLSMSLQCVNFIENVRRRSDPFAFVLSDYMQGYTRALQHHPLRVRYSTLAVGPEPFESVLNPALPLESQGCVLGDLLWPELMEWLNDRKIPYVVRRFGFYDERQFLPHHGVYLNRNGATHKATTHLMELGHRRIGFLGQIPREGTHSAESLDFCYEGYRTAFCVAGRGVNSAHMAEAMGESVDDALAPALRLLQLADRPTALVCQNDLIAFGAMKAARQLGLRVPEDLSIFGFDNDPAGEESSPPLTTFRGHEDLAAAAMECLFAIASGETTERATQPIECPMVVRKSTAPPRES